MYYVYSLIDPDTDKPFYIGKGIGDRALTHQYFKSGCNNPYKDSVIRRILASHKEVPYKILKDGFQNESDAYDYEELVIKDIGIENLTNICESRRPPSQLNLKRSANTIKKIQESSKKQGLLRTIEYVKSNAQLVFDILTYINNGTCRSTVIDSLSITKDLFNKIKKNYSKYCDILNKHTSYQIKKIKLTKLNGMQIKLFSSQRDTIIKIFDLEDRGYPRREICKILNIHLSFYDRIRNKRHIFFEYLKNTIEVNQNISQKVALNIIEIVQ